MAQDHEKPKPPLPGNHGQFGTGNATEEYKPLPDPPSPPIPADGRPSAGDDRP